MLGPLLLRLEHVYSLMLPYLGVFVVRGNTRRCFHDCSVHGQLFITDKELKLVEYFRFVISRGRLLKMTINLAKVHAHLLSLLAFRQHSFLSWHLRY